MGSRRNFCGGGGGGWASPKKSHIIQKNSPHREKVRKRPPHGEKGPHKEKNVAKSYIHVIIDHCHSLSNVTITLIIHYNINDNIYNIKINCIRARVC